MKVAGIIVEYNPFHLGHKYHIKKTREITNADYIVAIMTGNFMQRGTPAICDKWNRTKMALKGGVDLLIELPLCYSIRSAEYFAQASMRLLNALGIVDNVVFGSEYGKIDSLQEIAKLLITENSYYKKRLNHYLNKGMVFPAARKYALIDQIKLKGNDDFWAENNIFQILNGSNNILGIEYLKAKYKFNLDLNLKTIKRIGQDYHSKKINDKYVSATSIRKYINKNELTKIKDKVPNYTYQILDELVQKRQIPLNINNLGIMLLAKIRRYTISDLTNIGDINENLAHRIKKAAKSAGNYKQLVNKLNTRSFTKTRFQRILMNIIFDLQKDILKKHDKHGPSYLRILGISKKGKNLLTHINNKTQLPVVINPSEYINDLTFKNENLLQNSLSYDILGTDIYNLLYNNSEYRKAHKDFTKEIIKLD
ncbi:MAG: nucleotidyltransferase [Halanaerobiales bacterium]|nr:nucleotidyltransferase [Halanaerobiales bacterium]